MALLTNQMLEEMLGRPVEPLHVLISKNVLLGGSAAGIADQLGVSVSDVQGEMERDEYKEIHTLVASHANQQKVDSAFTLDDIEQRAWAIVAKRLEVEKDIEVAARIATMANRAVRRVTQQHDILDPSRAAETVKITLTRRVIESIQSETITRGTEEQILVRGRSLNPTFRQVEELLSPREPRIQEVVQPQREEAISLDAIMERLNDRR